MDANQYLQSGYAFYNGKGVPLDRKKAVEMFVQAAKAGSAEAYYVLGYLHANGDTVPKNMQKAIAFYEKAASGNSYDACEALGDCYSKGIGVAVNYDAAFRYYRIGAEAGHAGCLFEYGVLAMDHFKQYPLAMKCFELSAQKGYEKASCYFNMGMLIQRSKGDAEAAPYYKAAAELGMARAMDQYGLLLVAHGRRDQGISYLQMALDNGYGPAKNHLKMAKIANGNGIISSLLG